MSRALRSGTQMRLNLPLRRDTAMRGAIAIGEEKLLLGVVEDIHAVDV